MPNRDLTALLLLTVLSCACGGSSPLTPSTTEAHPRTVDTPAGWTASARQPDGSGCPIIIGLGAKGYELPHPGQWLRASYTMSICGPDEWSNQWSVTPQPALMDICENSTALAAKQCGHVVGKFLWIGTPGVYDVTATAPGGVGTTTLYGVVVD